MASYLQLTFKVQKRVEMYRENDKAYVVEWTGSGELGGSKASWEFWDCVLASGASLPQLQHGFSFLTWAFFSSFPTWSLFPRYSWPITWQSQISLLNSGSFPESPVTCLSAPHCLISISKSLYPNSIHVPPAFWGFAPGCTTPAAGSSQGKKSQQSFLVYFPLLPPYNTTVFLVVRFSFQTMSSFVTSPFSQPYLSRSLGKI